MNFTVHHSPTVELPQRNSYPIEEMRVGDFLFTTDYKTAQSARVAAAQYAKRRRLEWKFSIRKMRDGWRIFRVN